MNPGQEMRLSNLPRAAQEGNAPELKRLLSAGADPNEPVLLQDGHLVTPLMLAAASSGECVRLLLQYGANPNATSNRNESALWFALPSIEPFRVLLEAGIDQANLQSALCRAACLKNANAVRLLLKHGASPNAPQFEHHFRIPLFAAAEAGDGKCIHLLLNAGARPDTRDISGRTALMHASSQEAVIALVAGGCDLSARDAFDYGAIDHAAEHHRIDALFALVKACCDIDARNHLGIPHLLKYCASTEVDAATVQAMIDAGANVFATWFRGRGVLHECVQLFSGDRVGKLGPVVRILVAAGVPVDARDEFGQTPLHYSVGEEGTELGAIEALIDLGADVNAKDRFGLTPLMLATRAHRAPEAVALLLKLGADPTLKCGEGLQARDHAKKHWHVWKTIVTQDQSEQLQLKNPIQYERHVESLAQAAKVLSLL